MAMRLSQQEKLTVIYLSIEHIIHVVHAVFDNFIWKAIEWEWFSATWHRLCTCFFNVSVDGNHILIPCEYRKIYSIYYALAKTFSTLVFTLWRCGSFLITNVKIPSTHIIVRKHDCRIEFNAPCAGYVCKN